MTNTDPYLLLSKIASATTCNKPDCACPCHYPSSKNLIYACTCSPVDSTSTVFTLDSLNTLVDRLKRELVSDMNRQMYGDSPGYIPPKKTIRDRIYLFRIWLASKIAGFPVEDY